MHKFIDCYVGIDQLLTFVIQCHSFILSNIPSDNFKIFVSLAVIY